MMLLDGASVMGWLFYDICDFDEGDDFRTDTFGIAFGIAAFVF